MGLDNLDLSALHDAGVVTVAALGANAASVAEHALCRALALARGLVRLDTSTRRGSWERALGRELAGGTWGLLSAGATARATGALARGIGMQVLAYDPYVDPDASVLNDTGISLIGLQELLERSDVVSVHLPATRETAGLIDALALQRMKPDALLINVGRGGIIDEDALADALERGHLAGVALDVRALEPPELGRLEDNPRTLLTPHVAGMTDAAQGRIADVLVAEIESVLEGGEATLAVGSLRRPHAAWGVR